jgi:YidC/Oxa1 family membrane protein insertase
MVNMFTALKLFFREFLELNKFRNISAADKQIVFFSESPIYYQYYECVINEILKNSDFKICYITFDAHDPVFKKENNRFKVFYIKYLVIAFIKNLDAKVFVMTMPDLNQFYIKRSMNKVNHLYVFHAIVSTHMMYRKGAFDYYDAIFCVGRHHKDEIRRYEEMNGLKQKVLVEIGYPRLEKIYRDHQEYIQQKRPQNDGDKIILIAPSWGQGNILENCIDPLVSILSKPAYGYKIVIRPHPQFLRLKRKKIAILEKKFEDNDKVVIERDLVSDSSLHNAEVLITDWSGVAFEYAFGTERPVLFINTPRKVHNPEYKRLGIEPLEVTLRSEVGENINIEDISSINEVILKLLRDRQKYKEKIQEIRNRYIYNWGDSARVSAEYIINMCK